MKMTSRWHYTYIIPGGEYLSGTSPYYHLDLRLCPSNNASTTSSNSRTSRLHRRTNNGHPISSSPRALQGRKHTRCDHVSDGALSRGCERAFMTGWVSEVPTQTTVDLFVSSLSVGAYLRLCLRRIPQRLGAGTRPLQGQRLPQPRRPARRRPQPRPGLRMPILRSEQVSVITK